MNRDRLQELVQARGGDAVRAAAEGDWGTASKAVSEIAVHPGGVVMLLYSLADTITDANRRAQGIPAGEQIALAQPAWRSNATGRTAGSAGDVPPHSAWCGQFLAARAMLDRPTCEALLTVFPEGITKASPYIATLIASCASVIQPPPQAEPGSDQDQLPELTGEALAAAAAEDWDTAAGLVDQVIMLAGGAGLARMLMIAADWFITTVRPPAGVLVQPAWTDRETGTETGDASEADPADAWAGQLIAARANRDDDMCDALLRAFPLDEETAGEYLQSFLYACSAPIHPGQAGG